MIIYCVSVSVYVSVSCIYMNHLVFHVTFFNIYKYRSLLCVLFGIHLYLVCVNKVKLLSHTNQLLIYRCVFARWIRMWVLCSCITNTRTHARIHTTPFHFIIKIRRRSTHFMHFYPPHFHQSLNSNGEQFTQPK